MFRGSVFSMCCTVASRLYFSGDTTRIEYIGGARLLSELVELPDPARLRLGRIEVAATELGTELALSVFASFES